MRRGGSPILLLLLPLLALALPVIAPSVRADPAEAAWKDAIFAWLADTADPGKTPAGELTHLPAFAALRDHRFGCLDEAPFRDKLGRIYLEDADFPHWVARHYRFMYLQLVDDRYWVATGSDTQLGPDTVVIVADTKGGLVHFGLVFRPRTSTSQAPDNSLLSTPVVFALFPDPDADGAESVRIIRSAGALIDKATEYWDGQEVVRPDSTLPEPRVHAVTCAGRH